MNAAQGKSRNSGDVVWVPPGHPFHRAVPAWRLGSNLKELCNRAMRLIKRRHKTHDMQLVCGEPIKTLALASLGFKGALPGISSRPSLLRPHHTRNCLASHAASHLKPAAAPIVFDLTVNRGRPMCSSEATSPVSTSELGGQFVSSDVCFFAHVPIMARGSFV